MKNQISKREQEVLHLIAHENSTKMIARELYISEHTVISHRKNLMMKLNASNTAGLVRRAYETGFLKLSRQVAVVCFLLIGCNLFAQLETEIRTDGIVVPRGDTSEILTPVEGMFFYSTADSAFMFYDGAQWSTIGTGQEAVSAIDSVIVDLAIKLKPSDTNESGQLVLNDAEGNPGVIIYGHYPGQGAGYIELFNGNGVQTAFINGDAPNHSGRMILKDSLGMNRIQLNTNHQSTGDARVVTDEIEIRGGSDLAELFDITTEGEHLSPGMIVSLDEEHPGKLILSSEAYDKKVAGVISGANGIKPGILMGQDETIATGDDLVTLSGRTYVKANTSNGNIKVGDLITTSDVAGEAMKAKHKRKSQGAIIGKAMTPLTGGNGYVLVLVNLQ